MIIVQYFFVIVTFLGATNSRGPHHPRGEAVITHVHYRPTKNSPQKLSQDAELLHDKEHLQEHLENIVEEPDLSKMTDDELEFYYFQVHDSDKNSKLDGLEILQAITHIDHDENTIEDNEETRIEKEKDFEYLIELIDRVLNEDDLDNDGFLSYPEFVSGRKKEAIAQISKEPSIKMMP